jgi:hypothetical protein
MSNQHEDNAMGGYEPEQEATHSLYDEKQDDCELRENLRYITDLVDATLPELKHKGSAKADTIFKVTEAELVGHCWEVIQADPLYKNGAFVDPVQATVEAILYRYTLVKKGA